MKKIKTPKNYLFIDTNVFISGITDKFAQKALSEFKNKLEKGDFIFVLPEIIKVEILTAFENYKKDLFKMVEENLSTKRILGILDEDSNLTEKDSKKKPTKKNNIYNNSEIIDNTINKDRAKLIKSVKRFYDAISKEIIFIFNHKNTSIVELDNEILLSGIKRSLLKKAPYTRLDKTTENAHTKDADCVAWESLIYFLKEQKANHEDNLMTCLTDKDYLSTDRKDVHSQVSNDLKKVKHKNYDSLLSLFDIKTGEEQSKNTTKSTLSLAYSINKVDFSQEDSSNIANQSTKL